MSAVNKELDKWIIVLYNNLVTMILLSLLIGVIFGLPIELVSLGVDVFALAFSFLSLYDNKGEDMMARTMVVISIGTYEVCDS